MSTRKAHHSRVTEKDVTGIGVLNGAAMSRNVSALRLFCRLGASSFGRPGGGAARLAGAPPVFLPRSVALPSRKRVGGS